MDRESAASKILLREFQGGDQIAARTLILEGLGEHFAEIREELNPDLRDIASFYQDNGHYFTVAVAGPELVGTGGLVFESPNEGRIVRLSVRPGWRRMGIAQAIVAELIKRGQESSLEVIRTETHLDWHPAITLYESLGFVEEGQDDVSLHLILVL